MPPVSSLEEKVNFNNRERKRRAINRKGKKTGGRVQRMDLALVFLSRAKKLFCNCFVRPSTLKVHLLKFDCCALYYTAYNCYVGEISCM